MWPQTSVGTRERERDPELVAEHRDAVAGVLVVAVLVMVTTSLGIELVVHQRYRRATFAMKVPAVPMGIPVA